MILKSLSEPWFSYVRNGDKTYEGRLDNGGFWSNLQTGDRFYFSNKTEYFEVEVITILKFDTFVSAFNVLGSKLLPAIYSSYDAKNIYNNYYSDIDINTYGVVVIEVGQPTIV